MREAHANRSKYAPRYIEQNSELSHHAIIDAKIGGRCEILTCSAPRGEPGAAPVCPARSAQSRAFRDPDSATTALAFRSALDPGRQAQICDPCGNCLGQGRIVN